MLYSIVSEKSCVGKYGPCEAIKEFAAFGLNVCLCGSILYVT